MFVNGTRRKTLVPLFCSKAGNSTIIFIYKYALYTGGNCTSGSLKPHIIFSIYFKWM